MLMCHSVAKEDVNQQMTIVIDGIESIKSPAVVVAFCFLY